MRFSNAARDIVGLGIAVLRRIGVCLLCRNCEISVDESIAALTAEPQLSRPWKILAGHRFIRRRLAVLGYGCAATQHRNTVWYM
jgi:hypothetical protein